MAPNFKLEESHHTGSAYKVPVLSGTWRTKNLLLLLLLTTLFGALPSTSASQFLVTVDGDLLNVTVSTVLLQNISGAVLDFKLRPTQAVLVGENASSASQLLQGSIQSKIPGAEVMNLQVRLNVDDWTFPTGPNVTLIPEQRLELTMQFQLKGAVRTEPKLAVDMSWRSISITQPFSIADFEVNTVGETYFVPPMTVLAEKADPVIAGGVVQRSIIFTFENRQVGGLERQDRIRQVQNATSSIRLLDYSELGTPLDSWQRDFDPVRKITVYSLSSTGGFEMLADALIAEEEIIHLYYDIRTSYDTRIEVPGLGANQGDIITSQVDDSPLPQLMLIAVAGVASVLVIGILLKPRVSRKTPVKRRK